MQTNIGLEDLEVQKKRNYKWAFTNVLAWTNIPVLKAVLPSGAAAPKWIPQHHVDSCIPSGQEKMQAQCRLLKSAPATLPAQS